VTQLPGSPAAPTAEARLRVRLYVAGDAPNSAAASSNLQAALAACPDSATDVEIIDVLHDAERALRDGVLVTPMLVKVGPPPERRILGNLNDRGALLRALGLGDGMT
jgi:circadian clock protein KaiB